MDEAALRQEMEERQAAIEAVMPSDSADADEVATRLAAKIATLEVQLAVMQSANDRKDRIIARMSQQLAEQGRPEVEVPAPPNRQARRAAGERGKPKAAARKKT